MESINEKMDTQLRTRVDELTRANDENQDGRLDAADLKAQLNRIEAQLELQDQQNRGIIANQHKRMILSVVLVAVILVVLAFFGWRINVAYNNVMAACDRRADQSGHAGSEPAGRHDAGSARDHRAAEKN